MTATQVKSAASAKPRARVSTQSNGAGAGAARTTRNRPISGEIPTLGAKGAERADLDASRRLAFLQALIGAEDKVRAAGSETELVHLIANELRKVIGARQVMVFRATGQGRMMLKAVSSVAVVDRETPFVRWAERMAETVGRETSAGKPLIYALPAFAPDAVAETASYPFPHILAAPLSLRSGAPFGLILVTRERPWMEADGVIAQREADVFASLWASLAGPKALRPRSKRWRRAVKGLILAAVAALMMVPVPMTALAPVEMVARDPRHVTAPLDGIVDDIPIAANAEVKAGDVLVRFDDTTLRNALEIAKQELEVAKARYERTRQAAFVDPNARHELAIHRNEYLLKRAELDYAAEQLARTVVTADRDGILIYGDADKIIGRPFRIGERLMQIADPASIEARIELSVADAIVLEKGTHVRLFLDSDPLNSIDAKLTSTAYHAEANSTQQLVYPLKARFSGAQPNTRIGARGTAQLTGEDVPLIYFLLRRPISALRQYVGL